jgi:hypothetical protein
MVPNVDEWKKSKDYILSIPHVIHLYRADRGMTEHHSLVSIKRLNLSVDIQLRILQKRSFQSPLLSV